MTPEEISQHKDIEYYASSVNAWFNTSLEHDKSILALAAGGIGLLITLLTTVGLSSAEALVLYVGAITSFLVALVSVLVVFRQNRTYIEQVLAEKVVGNDSVLAKADSIALWAFGVGVVFTAVIGIATAIHSYTSKEKVMANKPTKPNLFSLRIALTEWQGSKRVLMVRPIFNLSLLQALPFLLRLPSPPLAQPRLALRKIKVAMASDF